MKFAEPLPFCKGCAHKAAELQGRGGPPGGESEAGKAQWHHDVAIIGTAAHHQVDLVITTDKTMYSRYSSYFDEVVYIPPAGG